MTRPGSWAPEGPDSADKDRPRHGVVVPLASQKRPGQAVRLSSARFQLDGALALKSTTAPAADVPGRGSGESVARTAVIVARALLEVLTGRRPASQLARWTSYPLQEDLERRAPRRATGSCLKLHRVRVREQAPGIVEVCALAEDPARQRIRVIALRLERRADSWIVTRLQAG